MLEDLKGTEKLNMIPLAEHNLAAQVIAILILMAPARNSLHAGNGHSNSNNINALLVLAHKGCSPGFIP